MSIAITTTVNTTTRPAADGGVHDGGDDDEPDARGGSTRAGISLDATGFQFTPDVLAITAGRPVDQSFHLVDGSGATVSVWT